MKKVHAPFRQCDNIVNNGSAVRVVRLRAGEETVIDPLGDDDVGELQISLVQPGFLEAFLREGE